MNDNAGVRSSGDLWLSELTTSEVEVMNLVAMGLSNHEIAGRRQISVPTVKAHISRLLEKLGCRSRVELTIIAHRGRLYEEGDPGPIPERRSAG